MTRLLLALPFLAACVHTPTPCVPQWPYNCEDRGDGQMAQERPVDAKPQPSKPDGNGAETGDKSRDDNGDSSDDNGASSDENGGKS